MGIMNWLNERLPLESVREFSRKKKIPLFYGTVWYYFGGISLFLFTLQVVTGILLALYYQPGASTSYESLKFIISRVHFGWLIRDVHSWSANLFVFFAFVHMFTVFFARAYRKPRELTWYSGMLLLVLVLTFGFTGYLLPWNELSYFATKVGSDIMGALPIVGDFLLKFMRAGEEVSGATLARFYSIHVSILPMVFLLVLAIHLTLIQIQGISIPPEVEKLPPEKRRYLNFFPNFALRDLLVWLVVLDLVALLAVFFPWELGPKADPLAPAPAGIRPEWYFMFMFQTLRKLPSHVLFMEGELFGILMFGLGGLLLFLTPALDRGTAEKRNKLLTAYGVFVIIYMVVMTIWGYYS